MLRKRVTLEEAWHDNYLRDATVVAVREYIDRHAARLREPGQILHFSPVKHAIYTRPIVYMEQFGDAALTVAEDPVLGRRALEFGIVVPVAPVYKNEGDRLLGVDRTVRKRRLKDEDLNIVMLHVNSEIRKRGL